MTRLFARGSDGDFRLDQVYPKGLPSALWSVGIGNVYKSINVKPAVDLSRLEMVLVVLKPSASEQQALNRPLILGSRSLASLPVFDSAQTPDTKGSLSRNQLAWPRKERIRNRFN